MKQIQKMDGFKQTESHNEPITITVYKGLKLFVIKAFYYFPTNDSSLQRIPMMNGPDRKDWPQR